jgi:hypothetical protein
MKAYHSPGLPGNEKLRPESALPLFAWAAATKPAPVASLTPSRAALHFAARTNRPLATVLTLARIAGFPEYDNA